MTGFETFVAFGTLTGIWHPAKASRHIDQFKPKHRICLGDVSECVSEGTLMSVNNRRLILRTAVYKDSDFGDYSAISMGCVEKVTLL